jgi:hypothetical protein
MDGNSYLDKIVPEQYHIPPILDLDMTRLQQFLSVAQPADVQGLPVINLGKIPQIPEVLVPRRLLKTAHKFYEAYTGDLQMGSAANPDLVFSLILLYNAWPAFYEHFSSGKVDHVSGILANFTEPDVKDAIPLSNKFTENRELKHYLTHCFIRTETSETLGSTLVACMTWLREVGLP